MNVPTTIVYPLVQLLAHTNTDANVTNVTQRDAPKNGP